MLERFRGPLIRVLVWGRVLPAQVTLLGVAVTGVAAYVAAIGSLPIAGAIFLAGSALDGLDGTLARATGRVSRFGAFLDSLTDRVGEGLILFGLFLHYLDIDYHLGATLAFLALFGSLLVSYARARAEGLGLEGAPVVGPRPARVVILGLGLLLSAILPPAYLTYALALVVLLTSIAVVQRGFAVWRGTQGG